MITVARAKRNKVANLCIDALRHLSFFSVDELESLTSRERAKLEYVSDQLAGLANMINKGEILSDINEKADTTGA